MGAAAPAARQPAGATRALPRRSEYSLPPEVAKELVSAVGRSHGAKLAERLTAASRAYARDRYPEAFRITKTLVSQVPESPSARELHGLVCYRMGRFQEAIRHLDRARALSGDDPSQLPVVMDCHRALGHHRRVEQLWRELRAASPDADVSAEGRLVMAATLADRGDIDAAIELLVRAGAGRSLRHPADRHLRQWYLLADLSERAGNLPQARDLFRRVADADPNLADVTIRLAGLGRGKSRSPRDNRRRASRPGGVTGSH